MKLLIAYDGSDSADTAIDGLQRAGLPAENVEALVVSIARCGSRRPMKWAMIHLRRRLCPVLKKSVNVQRR
jgi:hypothetical protein